MPITLVVEDGSGTADANSYADVAGFRNFHTSRGLADAELDAGVYVEEAIKAALIRATDYIDKRYGAKFKGAKTSRTNELEFPRVDVGLRGGYALPSNEIPGALKKATFEYAQITLTVAAELLPTPVPNFNKFDASTGEIVAQTGGQITRDRSRVGPVEEEKWFADPTKMEEQRAEGVLTSLVSSVNIPEYPKADLWLTDLITSGGTVRLVRGD